MVKKAKIALIDANALIHRAYHALPPMSTKDGLPTHAVFGFTSMLLKMFTTLKPTHAVAAFDVKGKTFRHKKFAAYKAHRKKTPEDLIEQFPIVKEVLAAFGIPIIEKAGYEADDIIGTLVKRIDGSTKKIIVTGDKDALQLVDQLTSVFTSKRGVTDTILYTPELVREHFGFGPEHIVDYKGLRGDPSDNIPGVAGVGDKTAKDVIIQFGSVENIYKHLDDIPARAKKRLEGKQKEALLSKDLATIDRDVPISFQLQDASLDRYNPTAIQDLFARLGFRSLMQRLPQQAQSQPTLFSKGAAINVVTLPENYHLAATEEEKKELQKLLRKQKFIAFDTENDSLGARIYPIVGFSVAFRVEGNIQAYYVPVTRDSVREWKDILEDPTIQKTGHNIKYDIEVLAQSGIHLRGVAFDSMIAGYLLSPGTRQYNMDSMAMEELGHRTIPIIDLIGTGKDQKKMSEVPLPELARYAAEDADITLQLYEKLEPRIKKEGLTRVMEEIEIPLIPVLVALELNGVAVDTKKLSELQKVVSHGIKKYEQEIWKVAGSKFNINSTRQLREVLYVKLKLPTVGIKRTQSGFSTAAPELAKLHGTHEVINYIEHYRELTKLKNTYIDTLPELVDKKTGRIYGQFNQVVAATGRLSSQDPNLQNIPARTELGQEIRTAFIAAKGNVLVKADYSQIELRLAAHMSQDEKMLQVFRDGGDIHRATAAWVYGIEPEKVSDQQRRQAKTLNFGVLYGMGSMAFARAADISVEEAQSFIGRYREQYNRLTAYIQEILTFASEHGYVETLLGRKRYVPELESNNPQVRAAAERAAFNFPLQGTAADIIKKAMIELQRDIEKNFPDARMVLTVHDELVVEVSERKATVFAKTMKKIMEEVITLDVPLIVDVAKGRNWRDMQPIKNGRKSDK
ncbi:MAG: DNA polymerase I [Candidatus Andersenbacteria bacterium]|nr:DNA polymerase I [Candidatus Andersenbacteria bacterium]MBI3251127.1 DNA polymerase I [Candidatus Andersenbacteria bacterium]